MEYDLSLPLKKDDIRVLRAGDRVYLSGELYTARDAAHKRLYEALMRGEKLPVDLSGVTLYYCGPSPARPGDVIGAAGPTTSSRMDAYTPRLIEAGVTALIGKGRRSPDVIEALIKHEGVYFAAIGGAGALIASCIRKSELLAYEDLGTEAIRRLTVEKLPLFVAVDSCGNDLYEHLK